MVLGSKSARLEALRRKGGKTSARMPYQGSPPCGWYAPPYQDVLRYLLKVISEQYIWGQKGEAFIHGLLFPLVKSGLEALFPHISLRPCLVRSGVPAGDQSCSLREALDRKQEEHRYQFYVLEVEQSLPGTDCQRNGYCWGFWGGIQGVSNIESMFYAHAPASRPHPSHSWLGQGKKCDSHCVAELKFPEKANV